MRTGAKLYWYFCNTNTFEHRLRFQWLMLDRINGKNGTDTPQHLQLTFVAIVLLFVHFNLHIQMVDAKWLMLSVVGQYKLFFQNHLMSYSFFASNCEE